MTILSSAKLGEPWSFFFSASVTSCRVKKKHVLEINGCFLIFHLLCVWVVKTCGFRLSNSDDNVRDLLSTDWPRMTTVVAHENYYWFWLYGHWTETPYPIGFCALLPSCKSSKRQWIRHAKSRDPIQSCQSNGYWNELLGTLKAIVFDTSFF